MKRRISNAADGFGPRLAALRKAKGMTQAELAEHLGVSRRVIAYYEHKDAQPPGPMLLNIAATLGLSVDQLLGYKQVKEKADPRAARLLNRIRQLAALPAREQKAVLLLIDGLLAKQQTHAAQAGRAKR